MPIDQARAVLLAAYATHEGDLPPDIKAALAKLIVPRKRKRLFGR